MTGIMPAPGQQDRVIGRSVRRRSAVAGGDRVGSAARLPAPPCWSLSQTKYVGYDVRKARRGDIPGIEAAYFRSWRAAYKDSLEPDVLNDQAQRRRHSFDWSRGIKDPTAAVFVAVDLEGVVLGVVQVNEVLDAPRDLPEITMLYGDPRAWGSGIASDLLSAGVDWIADREHTSARLRVAEGHLRPRRFYEREGWTPDPNLEPAKTEFARLIYYRRTFVSSDG